MLVFFSGAGFSLLLSLAVSWSSLLLVGLPVLAGRLLLVLVATGRHCLPLYSAILASGQPDFAPVFFHGKTLSHLRT